MCLFFAFVKLIHIVFRLSSKCLSSSKLAGDDSLIPRSSCMGNIIGVSVDARHAVLAIIFFLFYWYSECLWSGLFIFNTRYSWVSGLVVQPLSRYRFIHSKVKNQRQLINLFTCFLPLCYFCLSLVRQKLNIASKLLTASLRTMLCLAERLQFSQTEKPMAAPNLLSLLLYFRCRTFNQILLWPIFIMLFWSDIKCTDCSHEPESGIYRKPRNGLLPTDVVQAVKERFWKHYC